MSNGRQLALAIAAGYLLGRRKTKLALMVGTAAATGRFSGGAAGQLMRAGTKLVGSSGLLPEGGPGLEEVGGLVTKQLAPVAKRAAAAAVSSQISALSDQLRDRADAIREGSPAPEDEAEDGDGEEPDDRGQDEAVDQAREPARTARRRAGRAGQQARTASPIRRTRG